MSKGLTDVKEGGPLHAGPEMAQALERYRNTDFDDCDSGL